MPALVECVSGGDPVQSVIDVSGEWAEWLRTHKAHLGEIRMLTGSRFVEITADFVRGIAALQGIVRIYAEPAVFDATVSESLG